MSNKIELTGSCIREEKESFTNLLPGHIVYLATSNGKLGISKNTSTSAGSGVYVVVNDEQFFHDINHEYKSGDLVQLISPLKGQHVQLRVKSSQGSFGVHSKLKLSADGTVLPASGTDVLYATALEAYASVSGATDGLCKVVIA